MAKKVTDKKAPARPPAKPKREWCGRCGDSGTMYIPGGPGINIPVPCDSGKH